jgi:hypothetical protein
MGGPAPCRNFEALEVLAVLREPTLRCCALAREGYPALREDPSILNGRLPIA